MKTYRNREEGFKQIRNRALVFSLPIVALAIGTGYAISFYNAGGSDFSNFPYMLLFGLGLGVFGVFRGINRQRDLFNSYNLTIGDDYVQREQLNTPTVRINKADIQEIVRYANSMYLVKGRDQADTIIVSAQVEDYNELVATLHEMAEVKDQTTKSLREKFMLPFVLGGLVLMATVYLATNKYLVLAAGTAVVSGLVWSVYKVQTSKNVDRKTKRNMWWSVIVILSVLGVMYAKLVA